MLGTLTTPCAKWCAYCLGEIAHRQGLARDSRIVPALRQAWMQLFRATDADARAVGVYVRALRECVRSAPIPELTPMARQVIAFILERPEQRGSDLDCALPILAANEGIEAVARLADPLRSEPRHWQVVRWIDDTVEELRAEAMYAMRDCPAPHGREVNGRPKWCARGNSTK